MGCALAGIPACAIYFPQRRTPFFEKSVAICVLGPRCVLVVRAWFVLVLPMAPDTCKSSGLTGGDAKNSDKESPKRAISHVFIRSLRWLVALVAFPRHSCCGRQC